MKLDKAIEILSASVNGSITTFNADFADAEKLGIEALKRLRELRPYAYELTGGILPTETPTDTPPESLVS